MTRIERLAALRALRSRVDDEISDLVAQLAQNGTPEPPRPTRLQTISPAERDAFIATCTAMERRRRAQSVRATHRWERARSA